jgi:hypothetical protein
VEEQFYLVWPVFIALLVWLGTRVRSRRAVLTGGIVAMAVGSFAMCVYLSATHHGWAFFGSPPRFWEFAIGGLAGLAPVSWFKRSSVATALTVVGAVVIAVPIVVYGASTPFPGTTTLVPVAGTVMLLLAGAAGVETWVGRPLRSRPALWFGEHSYSWYLWHWPALIFAGVLWPSAGLPLKTVAVLVALGASMLSFRFVEQRVRYNRYLAARPRRSIAFGLAATGLCALIAFGVFARADAATKSPAQAVVRAASNNILRIEDCSAVATDPTTKCALGATSSNRTIVLFGDSHAAMWNVTFDRIGREHGYRVLPLELGNCPPADLRPFYDPPVGRVYGECAQWRERMFKLIGQIRPELVVFVGDAGYYSAMPGQVTETGLSGDDWTRGVEGTASRFEKMGVPFAMIADAPDPGFNVSYCLSRQIGAVIGGGPCVFDRDAIDPASRAADRAVERFKQGAVIDLTDEICPTKRCQAMRDGMVLYFDGTHLSSAFAKSLTPAMWSRLSDVLASTGHA